MLPGNPRILTCPFCGEEKSIMSLASGNTFGAVLWSYNKRIAPMLQEVSYIQKCPHCGKYYIISRQEAKFAREGYSFEKGLLSFSEMKEAFSQLMDEGCKEKEEGNIRMMLHHSYNDYYYRNGDDKTFNSNDFSLFKENAIWLIHNLIKDDVMKAEFYREIEEFSKAKEIIDTADIKNDLYLYD